MAFPGLNASLRRGKFMHRIAQISDDDHNHDGQEDEPVSQASDRPTGGGDHGPHCHTCLTGFAQCTV